MKLNIIRFYSSLIFLYFSDMSLLITIMWLSYEITNSSFFLGTMLSVSAVFPLILKKISHNINLLSLSILNLMKTRVFIYIFLVVITNLFGETIYSLILLSILTGLLSVTILSSYEARNIQLVLENKIEKSLSARVMQTVIQVGAFSGAIIGSILLESIGFQSTIFLISILDIIVCLLMYFSEKKEVNFQENLNQSSLLEIKNKKSIYLFSVLLGLIALHISAFNLTVPIIFQDINHWDVMDFGFASGLAGLGAFSAVFFKNSVKRVLLLLIAFIFLDVLFMFNQSKSLITPFCFMIGFCINSIRIFVREKLIGLAENTAQSNYIASVSTLFYILFQSLGSVFLGVLIGIVPLDVFTQLILPFIALLILSLFVIIQKLRGNILYEK